MKLENIDPENMLLICSPGEHSLNSIHFEIELLNVLQECLNFKAHHIPKFLLKL